VYWCPPLLRESAVDTGAADEHRKRTRAGEDQTDDFQQFLADSLGLGREKKEQYGM
jgi:hypothetical protein